MLFVVTKRFSRSSSNNMGAKSEETLGDVHVPITETFDNLVILKEFENIVNVVSNEDFLEIVPKAKLRMKWIPMFDCLRQSIYEEIVEEFNYMWMYENITEKLEILEKQKEKYNESNILWRPQLGNVKCQLKTSDAANLKKQKLFLELLAKKYEDRVNRLKKIITAKRGYIKAMQMDIQKYQKKNDEFISKMNYKNLIKSPINVETTNWSFEMK